MLSEADGLSYAIDLVFGAYGAFVEDIVPGIFCLASFGIVSVTGFNSKITVASGDRMSNADLREKADTTGKNF